MKLSQYIRALPALAPQDITTQRQGAFLDVSGAQRLLAATIAAAISNGKTVTIGFLQARDAAGTGAKALGTPVVLTAAADGAFVNPMAEAQIGDLDTNNGFTFVAVTLVSNNASAVQAGAMLILGDNRYNP